MASSVSLVFGLMIWFLERVFMGWALAIGGGAGMGLGDEVRVSGVGAGGGLGVSLGGAVCVWVAGGVRLVGFGGGDGG